MQLLFVSFGLSRTVCLCVCVRARASAVDAGYPPGERLRISHMLASTVVCFLTDAAFREAAV
jgi:hypothetical protein